MTFPAFSGARGASPCSGGGAARHTRESPRRAAIPASETHRLLQLGLHAAARRLDDDSLLVFGDDGARGSGSSSIVERLAPRSEQDVSREQEADQASGAAGGQPEASSDALASAVARREAAQFASAEQSLRQALQDMPELAELSRHVLIEETPEGLRIQLIDQEGRPMFEPGAIEPNSRARVLLRTISEIVLRLPNRITISGHTDASPAPVGGVSNWELSSARANAALNIMTEAGIPDHRIAEVRGKAGAEPLFPDDPYLPGNRRLSITLLREAPAIPPGHSL